MKTFIYEGTRNGSDTPITFANKGDEPQGIIRGNASEPTIVVGDEIKMPVAEAERLSAFFILTDVKKEEVVGGDETGPETVVAPENVIADPSSTSTETKTDGTSVKPSTTSPSTGTISSKATTSGTSSK